MAMLRHRLLLVLLAGVTVFATSVVCGFGASAPAPTADFNAPSGGGEAPEPTSASAPTTAAASTEESPGTQLPLVILPTATVPSAPDIVAPQPAIPEYRRLTLEYPAQIRTGDSDVVRLTLEVDSLGNVTPTAEVQGNVVKGQTVAVPNLYDTHIVLAEARLDLAGVDIRPTDDVSEPLLPGQSVTFFWSVHPESEGTYRGTVWLFLHFIDKTTKAESQTPLAAQTIQISSTSLLGLSGSLARTAGGIGSVLGAVLGIPFADDILKWLWKRVRGSA